MQRVKKQDDVEFHNIQIGDVFYVKRGDKSLFFLVTGFEYAEEENPDTRGRSCVLRVWDLTLNRANSWSWDSVSQGNRVIAEWFTFLPKS